MKKLALIALLGLAVFTLMGCGKKTVITKDEFIQKAEANKMLTEDNSAEFAEYDYLKSVISAGVVSDNTVKWKCDFMTASDDDYAKRLFASNKEKVDGMITGSTSNSSVNMGNYNTYSLNGDGKYAYLSRVDDTLLYLVVDEKYKEEAKAFVKTLGY